MLFRSITRLVDMGVEPFLLASSLRGVLAQRLVRRLCVHCRKSHEVTTAEAALLVGHGISGITTLYEAAGCDQCSHTGYRGRMGLYRWLPVTAEIAQAIHARAPDTALEAAVTAAGWPALAADATRHLQGGSTSLGEVLRVVTL